MLLFTEEDINPIASVPEINTTKKDKEVEMSEEELYGIDGNESRSPKSGEGEDIKWIHIRNCSQNNYVNRRRNY